MVHQLWLVEDFIGLTICSSVCFEKLAIYFQESIQKVLLVLGPSENDQLASHFQESAMGCYFKERKRVI
jgi:hypothetical protein